MIIPLPVLAAYRRDLESWGVTVSSEPELERAFGQWVSFGAILESFLTEVPPAAQEHEAAAVQPVAATYVRRLANVANDRDLVDNAPAAQSAAQSNDLPALAAL